MKSPKPSIRNQRDGGLTLIEILVVVALFSVLVSIGLVFSFDSYRNYLFRAEVKAVSTMLSQARNRSAANFNESAHVFEILPNEYRIYPLNDPSDHDSLERNSAISIIPTTSSVIFEQLSGSLREESACSAPCTISLNNGLLEWEVSINKAGGILINN